MARNKKVQNHQQSVDSGTVLVPAGEKKLARISPAMQALFSEPSAAAKARLLKTEKRNSPQLVLAKGLEIGTVVHGEIVCVCNSPSSVVKGKCLWLVLEGREFLFPITGVIRKALQNVCGMEIDADSDNEAATKKLKGKYFAAKKLENGYSDKFEKDMFQFDVRTE